MATTDWSDEWPFEIASLSPLIAAEITGFDAARPIDDLARDSILEALGQYKVLVLRDQDLAPEAQADFTKRFGELEPHVNREFRGAGVPEVHPVNNLDESGKPGARPKYRQLLLAHRQILYAAPITGDLSLCREPASRGRRHGVR